MVLSACWRHGGAKSGRGAFWGAFCDAFLRGSCKFGDKCYWPHKSQAEYNEERRREKIRWAAQEKKKAAAAAAAVSADAEK